MLKVRIRKGSELGVKFFTFPGGEEHVRTEFAGAGQDYIIDAALTSSQEVMRLMLLVDSLRRNVEPRRISLNLHYLPYARQDRVANFGEPLSVKVMCDLLNSLKFDAVVGYDVHSMVGGALLDNFTEIPQLGCLLQNPDVVALIEDNLETTVIVAPDAGASKKAAEVAKYFKVPMIQCDKSRDTLTGEITGFKVGDGVDLDGKTVVVVDDICDGGGTFIGLGAEVRSIFVPESLNLYVTHGIFSKTKEVFVGMYDNVYSRFDWTDYEDTRNS